MWKLRLWVAPPSGLIRVLTGPAQATVQAALGPAAFAEAPATGQRMVLEEAEQVALLNS